MSALAASMMKSCVSGPSKSNDKEKRRSEVRVVSVLVVAAAVFGGDDKLWRGAWLRRVASLGEVATRVMSRSLHVTQYSHG